MLSDVFSRPFLVCEDEKIDRFCLIYFKRPSRELKSIRNEFRQWKNECFVTPIPSLEQHILLAKYMTWKMAHKTILTTLSLKPGNTGDIFLQLATQHSCVASWKALLHALPPTSSINVTQQNVVVASWSSMLHQVKLASTFFNKFFQLAATNFIAWQCLRRVVIRPTTLFNLQRSNVALQVGAICCSYYFTFTGKDPNASLKSSIRA